jgi:hypothetical protein
MRGYVEAQEAAHKYGYGALNEVEAALLRDVPTPDRDEPDQCACVAPRSTLIDGRWICSDCGLDTDLYREDEQEE